MTKRSAVRGRSQGKKRETIGLYNKLQFIAQAQKKDGDYVAHCIITNQTISAFDGCISIGAKIDEDFTACPHTHSLIAALSKCGQQVSLVADDKGLTVASDKLKVKVQCAPLAMMPTIQPDPILAPITDELKRGFEIVGHLAKEGAEHLVRAVVVLDPWIVSATNGHALMQYQHMTDLPPALALPRRFCDLVVKHPAPLTGFGWTPGASVTFWFEDDTFIKTQLMRGELPDFSRLFDYESHPLPLPEGFIDAISTVTDFSSTGVVEFADGAVWSDRDKETVASVEIEGHLPTIPFNGKTLMQMLPHVTTADIVTHEERIFVYGYEGRMRGVIMGIRKR